jgi:hypothetical protein
MEINDVEIQPGSSPQFIGSYSFNASTVTRSAAQFGVRDNPN